MSFGRTPRRHPRRAVVLASGGLDSTVMAYWMAARGTEVTMLSIDYGQRHRVELEYARGIAELLRCPHEILDLGDLGRLLVGSALTDDDVPLPDGRQTNASKHVFVVPNRNAIMLSVAVAVAAAGDFDAVVFGARAGAQTLYPDCRSDVIERYTRLSRLANKGLPDDGFEIIAPLLSLDRADIIRIGVALGVPFELTWSCYLGGEVHCGRCWSCVERKESFVRSLIVDPTAYQEMGIE